MCQKQRWARQRIPPCRESRAKGSSWAVGFRAGVRGGGCYLRLSLGWEGRIRAPNPGVKKPQPASPLAVRLSELTSWAMPEAAGRAPCSAGRLSLGELQPDTGVLLLLGEESAQGKQMGEMGTSTQRRAAQPLPQPFIALPPSNSCPPPS